MAIAVDVDTAVPRLQGDAVEAVDPRLVRDTRRSERRHRRVRTGQHRNRGAERFCPAAAVDRTLPETVVAGDVRTTRPASEVRGVPAPADASAALRPRKNRRHLNAEEDFVVVHHGRLQLTENQRTRVVVHDGELVLQVRAAPAPAAGCRSPAPTGLPVEGERPAGRVLRSEIALVDAVTPEAAVQVVDRFIGGADNHVSGDVQLVLTNVHVDEVVEVHLEVELCAPARDLGLVIELETGASHVQFRREEPVDLEVFGPPSVMGIRALRIRRESEQRCHERCTGAAAPTVHRETHRLDSPPCEYDLPATYKAPEDLVELGQLCSLRPVPYAPLCRGPGLFSCRPSQGPHPAIGKHSGAEP